LLKGIKKEMVSRFLQKTGLTHLLSPHIISSAHDKMNVNCAMMRRKSAKPLF